MEGLAGFLHDFRYVVPAIAGGVVSYLCMGFLYRGSQNAAPEHDGAANEVYRHGRRTGIFLYGLAIACFIMAALPAYALVYPDQWTPKILLIIGFGVGSLYCGLEAMRARLVVKPTGLNARGAFTPGREVAWADMTDILDYPSLQMFAIRCRNSRRIWVSYMMPRIGALVLRLNQHGLAVAGQTAFLEEMLKLLGDMPSPPKLVWFIPSVLGVWQTGSRHAAVLTYINQDGALAYIIHYSQGTVRQAVTEVLGLIEDETLAVEPEYFEDISDDLARLLADPLAWPPEFRV